MKKRLEKVFFSSIKEFAKYCNLFFGTNKAIKKTNQNQTKGQKLIAYGAKSVFDMYLFWLGDPKKVRKKAARIHKRYFVLINLPFFSNFAQTPSFIAVAKTTPDNFARQSHLNVRSLLYNSYCSFLF